MNVDDSKVYAHRFGSKIGINGLYIRATRVHWVLTCIISLEKTCRPIYFFRPKWNWFFSYFPFIIVWDFLQKTYKCWFTFHQGSVDTGLNLGPWGGWVIFLWIHLIPVAIFPSMLIFSGLINNFCWILTQNFWTFEISKWKFQISTRNCSTTLLGSIQTLFLEFD